MPNNAEHSKHSLLRLGVEASDLHRWMDQPSDWAGSLHRFFRHDPHNPPDWAVEKYGYELSRKIMLDHVELDRDFDNFDDIFEYLRGITIKEKNLAGVKNRRNFVNGKIVDVEDDMITIDCEYERFREGDFIGYVTGDNDIVALGEAIIDGKFLGIKLEEEIDEYENQVIKLVESSKNFLFDLQLDFLDKIRNEAYDKDTYRNVVSKVINHEFSHISINKKSFSDKRSLDRKYLLDDSQIKAVESILGLGDGEILLVVGPPGTGKTEVIAKAAYELSLRPEKILIASHTNRAVDNAIQKLPIEGTLRIGRAAKILAKARPYTLGNKALRIKGEELKIIEDEINELKSQLYHMEHPKINDLNSNIQQRKKSIKEIRKKIKDLIIRRNNLIKEERAQLLETSKIFGATLYKSVLYPLYDLCFDTILIDECSQVPLLLAMMGMVKAKKWVLIGDHKQLLPIYQVFKSLKHKKELRALSSFCFFKEKYGDRTIWLKYHYRSNKNIIGFSQKHVYDDKIRPAASCDKILLDIKSVSFKEYLDPHRPVVFINVDGSENKDSNHSRFNLKEIDVISEIVTDLSELKIRPSDIGVITTYRSQREKLNQKIRKRFLEISTVDSYQGREKDVIIYGVTSTKDFGFVEDENRLNVAFTRAKKKLIVIGNEEAILRKSPSGLLSKYISYVKERNGFYDYSDIMKVSHLDVNDTLEMLKDIPKA